MKAQGILISAFIAASLLSLAVIILYLGIYSYTSSYHLVAYKNTIYDILTSKAQWDAKSLAETIADKTGASYVRVNITIYDLLTGRVISRDYYEISEVGVSPGSMNIRTYSYSVSTRDAYLYTYTIVVGYR